MLIGIDVSVVHWVPEHGRHEHAYVIRAPLERIVRGPTSYRTQQLENINFLNGRKRMLKQSKETRKVDFKEPKPCRIDRLKVTLAEPSPSPEPVFAS